MDLEDKIRRKSKRRLKKEVRKSNLTTFDNNVVTNIVDYLGNRGNRIPPEYDMFVKLIDKMNFYENEYIPNLKKEIPIYAEHIKIKVNPTFNHQWDPYHGSTCEYGETYYEDDIIYFYKSTDPTLVDKRNEIRQLDEIDKKLIRYGGLGRLDYALEDVLDKKYEKTYNPDKVEKREEMSSEEAKETVEKYGTRIIEEWRAADYGTE